ncbi:hypothetical protein QTH87_12565 [Variovorax sp. J22P168]|uniref:hypothetical protein n=1 Tax=Variovorax jilinensis TaxID=3053513 RepID=UPI002576DB9B|nr:hypothetical protein [Variovorax sp. J22P168]MDM0013268.1 hypothetical protein [Variovorax sp. J22P168]
MTPQSHFMVVAPVATGRETALRQLLDTLNLKPGMADPAHPVLPFGVFGRLHFARFAILTDGTMADLEVFDLPRPRVPLYLSFLGECDGPARSQLAEFVQHAGEGLRRIFGHCESFDDGGDLLEWLEAHSVPVGAGYVNRIGRTVRQIRENSALQRALSSQVPRDIAAEAIDAQALRLLLLRFVQQEQLEGRLLLSSPERTPTRWLLRNFLHAAAPLLVAALLLIAMVCWPWLLPLMLLLVLGVLWQLRWHERRDPEFCPRPDRGALLAMQRLEDHDLTNSFTALGPVKPGLFRRWLTRAILYAIDYACRHVFGRGHLARVQTIHFARWVFMDDRRRVLFASSYDGSHESYMDDFIHKAAWGLNLIFSNGFGWPRTDWLIKGGARHEQRFKYYQRRHQLPTQVWYKAYPGLTLADLERHDAIRAGFDLHEMSDEQALAWLRLL